MLKIERLSKNTKKLHVQSIYLEIEQGDYFVILGELGSGKSLFLELLAGLEKADKGAVFYKDKNITNLKIKDRPTGIVFQDCAVFPHLSVRENIAYPIKRQGLKRNEINRIVAEKAGKVHIAHLLNQKTEKLLKHELKKVALARTLTLEPSILIFDEPLSPLDLPAKGQMRRILRSLNQEGKTIIHATRAYEEAVALANKIAIFENGKIIQSGKLKEVFNSPKSTHVAALLGLKNYFPVEVLATQNAANKKAILNNTLELFFQSETEKKFGFLMLIEEKIKIAATFNANLTQNVCRGRIVELSRTKYGYEALVDTGVHIFVFVSFKTYFELKLIEGKNVWVYFPPESIKFFEH